MLIMASWSGLSASTAFIIAIGGPEPSRGCAVSSASADARGAIVMSWKVKCRCGWALIAASLAANLQQRCAVSICYLVPSLRSFSTHRPAMKTAASQSSDSRSASACERCESERLFTLLRSSVDSPCFCMPASFWRNRAIGDTRCPLRAASSSVKTRRTNRAARAEFRML